MRKEIVNAVLALTIVTGTIAAFPFVKQLDKSEAKAEFSDLTDSDIAENNAEIEINDNSIIESRILSKAVDVNAASKDDVYHMMLNSIDYYDKVSGTMLFTLGNTDFINVVDFQCSLSDSAAYSDYAQYRVDNVKSVTYDNIKEYECTAHQEIFCDPNLTAHVNLAERQYEFEDRSVTTLDNVVHIPDEERFKIGKDGRAEVCYVADPTNVYMSNHCLFPQELTLGYLHDQSLWEIVGTTNCNGRICYVIEGVPTPEYGEKLNVSNFSFWVDAQTGVLVRYEGYDEAGNISGMMYTENLKFEENAESINSFNIDSIKDYKEIKQ